MSSNDPRKGEDVVGDETIRQDGRRVPREVGDHVHQWVKRWKYGGGSSEVCRVCGAVKGVPEE